MTVVSMGVHSTNVILEENEWLLAKHFLIPWITVCSHVYQIHRSCDKLEAQFGSVSLDIGGVEAQLLEHDASKQAVCELLKFAQNEADTIMSKMKDQVNIWDYFLYLAVFLI